MCLLIPVQQAPKRLRYPKRETPCRIDLRWSETFRLASRSPFFRPPHLGDGELYLPVKKFFFCRGFLSWKCREMSWFFVVVSKCGLGQTNPLVHPKVRKTRFFPRFWACVRVPLGVFKCRYSGPKTTTFHDISRHFWPSVDTSSDETRRFFYAPSTPFLHQRLSQNPDILGLAVLQLHHRGQNCKNFFFKRPLLRVDADISCRYALYVT